MNTFLHNHYPGDNEIYYSDRLFNPSRGLPQLYRGLSLGRRLRPAVNSQRKHTETRGFFGSNYLQLYDQKYWYTLPWS